MIEKFLLTQIRERNIDKFQFVEQLDKFEVDGQVNIYNQKATKEETDYGKRNKGQEKNRIFYDFEEGFFSVLLIAFIVGYIIVGWTYFKGSVPLGKVLMYGSVTIGISVQLFWDFFLKRDDADLKKGVILFVCIADILFGIPLAKSCYDLVKGPQEIVLKNVIVEEGHWNSSFFEPYRTDLMGTTEDGERIRIIVSVNLEGKVNKLTERNSGIIVFPYVVQYYKGLKRLYDIEVADVNYWFGIEQEE